MASRNGNVVYHVGPSGMGGWRVERIGSGESETLPTKEAACARARQLAGEAGDAQVVVHDEEGRIADEFASDAS